MITIFKLYLLVWFIPGLYFGISGILFERDKTKKCDWQDFIFIPIVIIILGAIFGPFLKRLLDSIKKSMTHIVFGSQE